eukprot:CAMPEP_0118897770 /NCGR_PEP_ID=MMETSP1166-20130328/5026_1 /TAXON_ID=1104430 /ORGANISM="Chrysoreinhardia sp, Strain CCMP3193" /LENGTH=1047 /DNA_ID=CAMNT_0006836849 /DNA_START=81 /DNA_END=3224 /DNA_ORIENTATION=+
MAEVERKRGGFTFRSPSSCRVEVAVTKSRKVSDAAGRSVNVASALPLWHEASSSGQRRQPAKVYPFELDPFQTMATEYIERDESVLVSAHTSAGKTVVAEYAIAKSFREAQRVIYTSPIKALSNQKFRDLQEEFGDVGLMTGDITINPLAKCLVMTTEILRSMLYRGSELMREVKWVIYDEIHYMRDRDRGVIWEESIILLPHTICYVFLSATIPNALQFAEWIAKIHRQPCHVVSTDYRPTPLAHYMFSAGGSGLHLVVDERGRFRESSFHRALAVLREQSPSQMTGDLARGDARSASYTKWSAIQTERKRARAQTNVKPRHDDLRSVLQHVTANELLPCIVFAFSKVTCERNANSITDVDYTDAMEKDLVRVIYNAAVRSLAAEDRTLPQVRSLVHLLERGIGIHHGGLLPIVKEVVEILFQEGLIKVLFATETFAIGINMPAKSVVFTECCKFDGAGFRCLTAGEYIQMSGRAGRRGKDKMGTVIQMLDHQVDTKAAQQMLHGEADPLNSSYQVTFNMLLNLLRVEGAEPEYLILSSFHQHQRESRIRGLLTDADHFGMKSAAISVRGDIEQVHSLATRLEATRASLRSIFIRQPTCLAQWLQPGRVVLLRLPDLHKLSRLCGDDWTPHTFGLGFSHLSWAVILAVSDKRICMRTERGPASTSVSDVTVTVFTFGKCVRQPKATLQTPNPMSVPLASIYELSALRLSLGDLINSRNLASLQLRWFHIGCRFDLTTVSHTWSHYASRRERDLPPEHGAASRRSLERLPLLDAHNDLDTIPDTRFASFEARAYALASQLHQACQSALTDLGERELIQAAQKCALKEYLRHEALARREMAAHAGLLVSKDELRRMIRVLKSLGHISPANGAIALKGRAACEVNSANELISAELLFGGAFIELEVQEIAALLTPLVFTDQRKHAQGRSHLRPKLLRAHQIVMDAATSVAEAMIQSHIPLNRTDFLSGFSSSMMEPVFHWAQGAPFAQILKLTAAYEGTVIRVIRHLDELLTQLASACFVIGNYELQKMFESTSRRIKRDIVFAASLYV